MKMKTMVILTQTFAKENLVRRGIMFAIGFCSYLILTH